MSKIDSKKKKSKIHSNKKSKVESEEKIELKSDSNEKIKSKVEEKIKFKIDSKEKSESKSDSEGKIRSKVDTKEKSLSESESQKEEAIDPFKDNERLKILKKIISHTCLLITVFAVYFVILGICAYLLYYEKSHLFIFGMICIMHLIGAPLGYYAVRTGNRILFMTLMILNLIWITSAVILLLVYWIFIDSIQFNQEIALHVGSAIYITAAIVLALTCFLMMKQLDMISVQFKKPTVQITTDRKDKKKKKK